MLIIQDVLISDDVVQNHFICNLEACKGACCWEGDFGAPLSTDEVEHLNKRSKDYYDIIPEENITVLEQSGPVAFYEEPGFYGTRLMPNGACVFMTLDKNGCAGCGIESVAASGNSEFMKPMSCHLYPIRVTIHEETGLEAWNYDKWDICSAACKLGAKNSVPVYQFLKNAIVRYKGIEFYEELEAAANAVFKQ